MKQNKKKTKRKIKEYKLRKKNNYKRYHQIHA